MQLQLILDGHHKYMFQLFSYHLSLHAKDMPCDLVDQLCTSISGA